MIYDTYDYDFLRLCGLCKYVPKELYKRYRSDIFCSNIVENLMYHKIIKLQNNKLSYKLTTKGKEVLAEMGDTFPEDVKMNINRVAYKRMLISARFTVLLHLAGINVFCRNIEQLNKAECGYICKHMLYEKYERRKIAGTRFLGILKLHDVVYIPYYVESSNDGILPKFEKSVFSKIVSDLDGVKKIMIMLVGETLEELCDNFFEEHEFENSNRGYRNFKRVLEILGNKFSFVSLDRDGVLQLNIMNIWRYKKLANITLNTADQHDKISVDKKASPIKEKAPPTITSEEKNEEIPEDTSNDYIVYRTATGKKFHRAGCSYLKSEFEITVEDAKKTGLTACSRCNP